MSNFSSVSLSAKLQAIKISYTITKLLVFPVTIIHPLFFSTLYTAKYIEQTSINQNIIITIKWRKIRTVYFMQATFSGKNKDHQRIMVDLTLMNVKNSRLFPTNVTQTAGAPTAAILGILNISSSIQTYMYITYDKLCVLILVYLCTCILVHLRTCLLV